MTLAGYNLQDNVYIYSNNKCMCVFLISPVPITEPLTSELIDTPVFYNLAPRPIKYRVSVPIPTHQARKVYKIISKEFGLHKSTVRQIVYNGGNSRPLLPSLEVVDQQRSLRSRACNSLQDAKVPRETSKQPKAFLTLANVNVHEPTIRRTLSNHGVHGAK